MQQSHRLENLRALMRERAIEALLVTAPASRRYLSGFTGSNGALLVSNEVALVFTDYRYRTQVANEAPAFALREISAAEAPLPQVFATAAVELGLRRVAFEAAHVSVAEHGHILAALVAAAPDAPPALVPMEGMVETLREQKDAAELAILKRAIAITDAAISAVIPRLQPEMSEKQAAWMLEAAMRMGGADGVAFPIIVAAGPNAALPHARPTDGPLGSGRPIVIDMGARLDGYHADLTRTIVLGEPDARFRQVYAVVRAAQQRAFAGLRAGISTAQADALGRDAIAAAGFGDSFGHGLGHGVGLDIHEGPWLRRLPPGKPDETPRLRAGAVLSVEPGIYLEGWGGVRIEDLVLLRENGCEVLSAAPKLEIRL